MIGEETDVDPDGSYVSHLALYLRAMGEIGASTRQFEKFRSLCWSAYLSNQPWRRSVHRPMCKPLSRIR